jgi:hypothetical protein
MSFSRIEGNVNIVGTLSCDAFTAPSNCVSDDAITSTANIDPDKCINRFRIPAISQAHGSAGTAERKTFYRARANATINFCSCYFSVAPTGDSTHTVKLKKNGSDILSADIVLNSSNTAYTGDEEQTGFTSASLVAGDVLEVAVTVSAGTGTLGQGLCVDVEVDEYPA